MQWLVEATSSQQSPTAKVAGGEDSFQPELINHVLRYQ
jgi:hypothetical protein